MSQTESIARIITWTGRNIAHNLDFIPDDKLNWKPAPDASSVLEIADHVTQVARNITALLQKDKLPKLQPTLTREQAQGNLVTAINDFAAYIQTLSDDDIEELIRVPRLGEVPMRRLITIAMIDTSHHHGQIAYIQTLLGDTESHFVERDF